MGKSEKRILGWEPVERHEYEYDDESGRVLAVIVTREAEWDDDSREDMLALAHYESGICACGFHESLTHDKSNHFTWDDTFCAVCAGAAQYTRRQSAEDDEIVKAMGDDPAPLAPRPADGRRTYTKLLTPAQAAERMAATSKPRPR